MISFTNNNEKIQVLLHALSQRYNALEKIRERVQNVSLWLLGLFVTGGGWLLQSRTRFDLNEKLYFTFIILVAVVVLRVFYLRDLMQGFRAQQKAQAKIEKELGLCDPGVFGPEPIYPPEWKEAGQKTGKGKFFAHNFLLIYTGTFLLLISIWVK